MTGKYLLETLDETGWVVRYDGSDPKEYAVEVFVASVNGETTRATCVGTKGARP